MAASRHASDTLDLFAEVSAPPARKAPFTVEPAARAAQPSARPQRPRLESLSDNALGDLLRDAVVELERRTRGSNRRKRPSLNRAIEDLRAALARIDRKSSRKGTKPVTELPETRRNATRSALRAGVSLGQVAKHFGLSPSTVRKIATQAD
jgi:hypothetical protein